MKIKIINRPKHLLPGYSTILSGGMDIRANLKEDVIIETLERKLIGTGLFLEITTGYEAKIGQRSGLANNKGVTILNSPVTVHADYRRKICVILINLSNENFVVRDGGRICQRVISKHEQAEWISVETLTDSERGAGGFGHTGKK